MVDTLVSGASASRRVGSTPISGTRVQHYAGLFFFVCNCCYIYGNVKVNTDTNYENRIS